MSHEHFKVKTREKFMLISSILVKETNSHSPDNIYLNKRPNFIAHKISKTPVDAFINNCKYAYFVVACFCVYKIQLDSSCNKHHFCAFLRSE